MRLHVTRVNGLLGSMVSIMMLACSSDDSGSGGGSVGGGTGADTASSGGTTTTGTKMNTGMMTGGMSSMGTMQPSGGVMSAGGARSTGGMSSMGTMQPSGGVMSTGGTRSTGGMGTVMTSTGVMTTTGGMAMTGGTSTLGTMQPNGGTMNAGGMPGSGGATSVGTLMNTGGMLDAGMTAAHFKARIENTSMTSALPTLIAPGVYAVTSGTLQPFTQDTVASPGLEAAAEDANPALLATEIMAMQGVMSSNAFDTPVAANAPGPLHPGDAYEFTFEAMPGERLHFASMFGQSNDTFVSTADGIALFDSSGMPVSGDVTSSVGLWNAGTERDEAPGIGPNQAPRQSMPNTGPAESGVSVRTDATRAIPIPSALVEVSVSLVGTEYSVTLKNKSEQGPLMSPLSPAFYALHDGGYRYFTEGSAASAGLERLAEEGNAAVLVQEANAAGAMSATAGTAAYGPGASVTFTVMPSVQTPRLSLAMMIGQTNDVFIGTRPQGVPLLDSAGMPRSALAVQNDIVSLLATWDAGTEENQVPGVGANQAPRQPAENTGPVDPDNRVRVYADSTNDLMHLMEMVDVKVMHTSGTTFDVVVSNVSADTAFPLTISPVAWVLGSETFAEFTLGSAASMGLERLAEDGASATLLAEWNASDAVSSSGVAGTGPFTSGSSVSFQVTADAQHPYLNFAAMLVPSNDTFMALGPSGVALLDDAGAPRTDDAIAAEIAIKLAAFEAGTEANQGSALGPDMAPYQTSPNTGSNEGSGRVRASNGVWPFPAMDQILRVTLMPL